MSPRQKRKKLYKRLIKRGFITGLEIAQYKFLRPKNMLKYLDQDAYMTRKCFESWLIHGAWNK